MLRIFKTLSQKSAKLMELKLPVKGTIEFISNLSIIIFEQLFQFHRVSDFFPLPVTFCVLEITN